MNEGEDGCDYAFATTDLIKDTKAIHYNTCL